MTSKVITIVVILLVITIIASLFLLQGSPDTQTPPIIVAPTTITPTRAASSFYVYSVYPQDTQAGNISVIASVQINFNEPFNQDSFSYRVSPDIQTNINFTSTGATITPKTSWPMGQKITITIASAQNDSGVSIASPYIIKMQVPVPLMGE